MSGWAAGWVVFVFSLPETLLPVPLDHSVRNTHIYTPLISCLINPVTHIDRELIHTGQKETARRKTKEKGDGRQTKQGGQEADAK